MLPRNQLGAAGPLFLNQSTLSQQLKLPGGRHPALLRRGPGHERSIGIRENLWLSA